MRNFQNERMVLVGMAVGASQVALDLTTAYCSERRAFGGHLSDLGAIRQRLAMRQAEVDAVRASMYHAAWMGDSGLDNVRTMSGLKAFGAEVANRVMYDCLQFHGGMGYMRECAIERMVRDCRLHAIGGGATDTTLFLHALEHLHLHHLVDILARIGAVVASNSVARRSDSPSPISAPAAVTATRRTPFPCASATTPSMRSLAAFGVRRTATRTPLVSGMNGKQGSAKLTENFLNDKSNE